MDVNSNTSQRRVFFGFVTVDEIFPHSTEMQRIKISAAQFKVLGARQQWKCNECQDMLTSTAQVDHIVPLHEGGTNHDSNLHVLCVECHAMKTQNEARRRCKYSPYFPFRQPAVRRVTPTSTLPNISTIDTPPTRRRWPSSTRA